MKVRAPLTTCSYALLLWASTFSLCWESAVARGKPPGGDGGGGGDPEPSCASEGSGCKSSPCCTGLTCEGNGGNAQCVAPPPTDQPTIGPTSQPTRGPTSGPTLNPATDTPTSSPTSGPTLNPATDTPTSGPTTGQPTSGPTYGPSLNPATSLPTSSPTSGPTLNPATDQPTSGPTPTPENPLCSSSVDSSKYNVCFVLEGTAIEGYTDDLLAAKDYLESIIVGDLSTLSRTVSHPWCPNAVFPGTIDDLAVCAKVESYDGSYGVVARATPGTSFLRSNGPTYFGAIHIDSADVARMKNSGDLLSVLTHELMHVVGLGSLAKFVGGTPKLITGSTGSWTYNGAQGNAEFQALSGCASGTIPMDSGGGHFDENCFGTELMTPTFTTGETSKLSSLTLAFLEDLGYTVDNTQADQYSIPSGASCLCNRRGLRNSAADAKGDNRYRPKPSQAAVRNVILQGLRDLEELYASGNGSPFISMYFTEESEDGSFNLFHVDVELESDPDEAWENLGGRHLSQSV